VSGALHPAETADRLIALDLPTIKGNHERQLLSGDRESLRLSDRWARDTLRDAHLAWIAALPPRLMLDDDVLMVHGTPASDLVYFLETVTPDGCRAATPDEIAQRAGDETASLILCGHTHVPRAATLEDGRLIVNPGSVGLQAYADEHPHPHRIENGTPHARYATVSRTAAGWHAEFHAIRIRTGSKTARRMRATRWCRARRPAGTPNSMRSTTTGTPPPRRQRRAGATTGPSRCAPAAADTRARHPKACRASVPARATRPRRARTPKRPATRHAFATPPHSRASDAHRARRRHPADC